MYFIISQFFNLIKVKIRNLFPWSDTETVLWGFFFDSFYYVYKITKPGYENNLTETPT